MPENESSKNREECNFFKAICEKLVFHFLYHYIIYLLFFTSIFFCLQRNIIDLRQVTCVSLCNLFIFFLIK